MEMEKQGKWETRSVSGHKLFHDCLFSNAPGSSLEIRFAGRELTLPLLMHDWSGRIDLCVDDHPVRTLELFSPHPVFVVQRFDLPATPNGHRLRLEVRGDKHRASHAHEVFIGRIGSEDDAAVTTKIRLTERVHFCHGGEGDFFVLANDTVVSQEILNNGAWAAGDVALFRHLIEPGETVFDVGANLGHHSVVYSKLVGPAGKVYSFEPQRYLFNALCANLLINDCRNVDPRRLALGESAGRLMLAPCSYDREDNFAAKFISTIYQDPTAEAVSLDSLDQFIANEGVERVDFLKIDVQSFELFVLRGAIHTLDRLRPRLFVEIAPYWMERLNHCDYRDIYKLLAAHNYVVFDKQLQPAGPREPDQTRPQDDEWDVVAYPKEQLARLARDRSRAAARAA